MLIEPLLVFFLLRHLKKIVQTFSPVPEWAKYIIVLMYSVVVLFILQHSVINTSVTIWIWHALLIMIIGLTFKVPGLAGARRAILAILPLAAVLIISNIIKVLESGLYDKINAYLDIASSVAITWMIAMFVRSNKQQKALETERQKTYEEEERSKIIAARKAELELLVAERTAELTNQKDELHQALTELRNTQTQLIQSEKMALLGGLTAGIAHEIQNPLNFVNNFAEVNEELIEEMKSALKKGNHEEAISIADHIADNEKKINHHGKRADAIVKGMLQHSRSSSSGQKELTDINALADEYLRLAYHGLRAKDKSFNAIIKTNFDESIGKIDIIPQDIGRVILNLITNAFYATAEKKKLLGESFQPVVTVSTSLELLSGSRRILISVKDNGNGIPQKVLDKIFQPFFTTKPTGQGTGLGLSLSYDIIKAHGGELKVETKVGEFAEFIIILPQ